jgi:hypothetical protein
MSKVKLEKSILSSNNPMKRVGLAVGFTFAMLVLGVIILRFI